MVVLFCLLVAVCSCWWLLLVVGCWFLAVVVGAIVVVDIAVVLLLSCRGFHTASVQRVSQRVGQLPKRCCCIFCLGVLL